MTEDLSRVPERLRWYFKHPGCWENIKQAILEHDPTCVSLPDIWLARTGGVSCPSDLDRCDDCDVTFYNEGLMGQYPPVWSGDESQILQTVDKDDGDTYEARLCECCGRKRREGVT